MKFASRGYTLVEVVISLAIISIMLAIVTGTYSLGRGHDEIKADTQKLSSSIRRARDLDFGGIASYNAGAGYCSLSSTTRCSADWECSALGYGTCQKGVTEYPQYGYGVYFNNPPSGKSYYIIFADFSNERFDTTDSNSDGVPDEQVTRVDLANNLRFTYDTLPGSIMETQITFKNNQLKIWKKSSGWQLHGDFVYETIIQNNPCSKFKGAAALDVTGKAVYDTLVEC